MRVQISNIVIYIFLEGEEVFGLTFQASRDRRRYVGEENEL